MKLTAGIVHYALSGLTTDAAGRIVRKHNVFAKISRPEVARLLTNLGFRYPESFLLPPTKASQ